MVVIRYICCASETQISVLINTIIMDQNNFTYCYLDLPELSESIIKDALTALETREERARVNPTFNKPNSLSDQKTPTRNVDSTYAISPEFEDWVREHFRQEPVGCGIHLMAQGAFGPHVDTHRSFSIRYLLDAGGDQVDTVWWREKGKPAYRPDLKNNWASDHGELEELDRLTAPLHKWLCINANVIHSVEGTMPRPRLAIQVSSTAFPDFINRYGVSFGTLDS